MWWSSAEEILRTLRNVACCFDPHQGIWQSLNWITCFTTTCSLMPWWQVRWAPILWTPSFSTLWNSLMVSMISMARKEISCSWHAWVTPCISHLKAGFNIVIIYLRSITLLHLNNFNNSFEAILIKVISISLLNSSHWVTKPINDLNNQYSETNSPINTDGCQTVWANVIWIMGSYIFGGCEVWFGISTWSYSVKNNMCAELFGLEMFIESFNLQNRHGGTSAPPFTCKSLKV